MEPPDLATVQGMFTELLADAEYMALVDSAGEAFVPGSLQDSMVALV